MNEFWIPSTGNEADDSRIRQAIEIGLAYGQCDGADHKMWVIDQMLRALLGDQYETATARDEDQMDWETGNAP